ncbi:hypothetical protein LCGC14_1498390 [marine sediment metagenome]|uniref:HNH domain-containing protein n=1 Tax=marine sediment metagenome TaxID=412755 RepID=A0A0F9JQN6_9ZZZZ
MMWNGLRRKPLRQVSKKQTKELALRKKLKGELIAEGPHDEAGNPLCNHCKKRPDFRGLQLVHKTPLSRGGKTDRKNCEVWCAPCHFGIYHGAREV